MAKNSNLHNAKAAKNDDFFTLLSDIEDELGHYWAHGVNHFEGKSVLMNCDNPKFSNFWVYFHKNFNKLKLTRIGAVHYSISEPAYYKEYTGGNDIDITIGNEIELRGNGDFRSEECIEILKGYDMVVTNPPFSLWREFIKQIVNYNKEFIVIGNTNAVTYKDIFPLFRDNKMWVGCTNFNTGMYFGVSDDFEYSKTYKCKREIDGKKVNRVPSCCWYTNIDLEKHHDYITLYREYNDDDFPTYDNFNVINVNKISEIPMDYFESFVLKQESISKIVDTFTIYEDVYEMLDDIKNKVVKSKFIALNTNGEIKIPINKDNRRYTGEIIDKLEEAGIDLNTVVYRSGIIGVPVTFINKYCPEQFKIIECTPVRSAKIWSNNHDYSYYKDFKRGKVVTNASADMPLLTTEKCGGTKCVRADGEVIYQLYHRIFIKPIIFVDTRLEVDKLSNDLLKILSLPGAIKQGLTYLRVVENE